MYLLLRRRRPAHDSSGRARPDGEWRANLHARSARAAPRPPRRRPRLAPPIPRRRPPRSATRRRVRATAPTARMAARGQPRLSGAWLRAPTGSSGKRRRPGPRARKGVRLDRHLVRRGVRLRRRLVRVPDDRRRVADLPPQPRRRPQGPALRDRASTPTATPTAGSACRSTSTPCCSSPSTSRSSSSTSGRSSSATCSLGGFVSMLVFVGDPAARPGLRLAQGGPDMAVTHRTSRRGHRTGTTPAATGRSPNLPAPATRPADVARARSSSPTRSGRRPTRTAYDGGREQRHHPPARVRGERARPARRRPLGRRPRGHPDQGRLRARPDPDEQPVAAAVGPRLLRDRDDVGGDVARTTWTAGACSRSGPARARRTCSSWPAR